MCTTRSRRRRLVAGLASVVLVGCTATAPPTGPASDEGAAFSWSSGRSFSVSDLLLKCKPLAADEAAQSIGREGGTIAVGPHTLEIPAGALRRSILITAAIVPDSASSVKLGPAGLTFAVPARLTLSYAHCHGAGISRAFRRVAYTTDALEVLKLLPSQDKAEKKTVSAWLDHFSRYAVAW